MWSTRTTPPTTPPNSPPPPLVPISLDHRDTRIHVDRTLLPDIRTVLAAGPRIRAPTPAPAGSASGRSRSSHVQRMHSVLQEQINTTEREWEQVVHRVRQHSAAASHSGGSAGGARLSDMEAKMEEVAKRLQASHGVLQNMHNRVDDMEASRVQRDAQVFGALDNTSDRVGDCEAALQEINTVVYRTVENIFDRVSDLETSRPVRDAVVFGVLGNTSTRVADLEATVAQADGVVGHVQPGNSEAGGWEVRADDLENNALHQSRLLQELEDDVERMKEALHEVEMKTAGSRS